MAEFPRDSQNSGISDTNGMGEAEEPIQGHLAADPSSNRLYSEVQKEFTDWFFSMSPDDFDEDLLDAYLEEMEALSPLESSIDSQASLKRFHERFPSLFEEQRTSPAPEPTQLPVPKSRRRFSRLATVAATIAAMMVTMISAQAFGVDIFGFFAHWTNDIFCFSGSSNQTQPAKLYPLSIGESAEYNSIEEALSEFQIDATLAPSWYPDGIGSLTVTVKVVDSGMKLYAVSTSNNPFLSLSISDFDKKTGPSTIIEKDSSEVTSYEFSGQEHYIVNDGEWCTAIWIVDDLECIIRSNIAEDEMIKIIDSIYEVS